MKRYISLLLMLTLVLGMNAQKNQTVVPIRSAGGHLDYVVDERGNRVPRVFQNQENGNKDNAEQRDFIGCGVQTVTSSP